MIIALVLIVLTLLIDFSLGLIKYTGFWSTFSINPLNYLVAKDLFRGSAVPWLCSLGFGLFLRAVLLRSKRAKETTSPILRLVPNTRLRILATIALLTLPFLFYVIVILRLPNHGMFARSPVFFAFLLCLFVVILSTSISISIPKAIAISLATYTMVAVTEGKIARKKACDRVQAGEIKYQISESDATPLPTDGSDSVKLGRLRDFSFTYEIRSKAVAVYGPYYEGLLSRTENITPKCAQYLKSAEG